VKFDDATPTESETETAAAATKHQQHSMFPRILIQRCCVLFPGMFDFKGLNHATEHPDTEF